MKNNFKKRLSINFNRFFLYCYQYFWVIVISHLIFSCRSDQPIEKLPQPEYSSFANTARVYIINEGNFGRGSGAISLYNPFNNELIEDLYSSINKIEIGNVCQSMSIIGNKGFIVVNNSNKIEVVDMVSFKNIGTIKNLTSPRYLVAIDSSTGYVSDLYSNKITIVNLSSFEIIGYIDCWGSTEEMLKIDDKVYITNTKTEYIYIANSLTNQIIDSLKLSLGSNSIVKDKENHIWVSCVGDNSKKIPAALYKINTNHLKVDLKFTFEQGGNYWSRVKTNLAGDSIFYIKQHLYAFSIKDPSFPKEPFINNNGRNIYGFGINPLNGEIYLADALDFSQRGIVYRYAQRKELSKFNASIIPSDFIFYPLNFNQKK